MRGTISRGLANRYLSSHGNIPDQRAGFIEKDDSCRKEQRLSSVQVPRSEAAEEGLEFVLEGFEIREDAREIIGEDFVEDDLELGGVEGAIGKRADETFTSLPKEAQAALDEILPLLITVDVAGEQSAVRRRASVADLRSPPARKTPRRRSSSPSRITRPRQVYTGSNARAWAFRILTNCFINGCRRRKRYRRFADETPDDAMDVSVKGLFWLLEAARAEAGFQQFVLLSGGAAVGHCS